MTACRMCGADPYSNRNFCAVCRSAEADTRRRSEPIEVLRARRLLADTITLERAWHEINDERNHSTPQVLIESIMVCVRTRGTDALKEPANTERLSRCDAAARTQINRRIQTMRLTETST